MFVWFWVFLVLERGEIGRECRVLSWEHNTIALPRKVQHFKKEGSDGCSQALFHQHTLQHA